MVRTLSSASRAGWTKGPCALTAGRESGWILQLCTWRWQPARVLYGTGRCRCFGTEFCFASTVSALRKSTKGKCCVQQFSVLNSAVLHPFLYLIPTAFQATSFTKPFPSLGVGNRLRWQSDLFSTRYHTKWAQWEDMEGNCVWQRQWQISDWELNKSAQVLHEIPAQDFVQQGLPC